MCVLVARGKQPSFLISDLKLERRVDPLEPHRVWMTTRPVGRHLVRSRKLIFQICGCLMQVWLCIDPSSDSLNHHHQGYLKASPLAVPPGGKLVELPPQTSSLTFNEQVVWAPTLSALKLDGPVPPTQPTVDPSTHPSVHPPGPRHLLHHGFCNGPPRRQQRGAGGRLWAAVGDRGAVPVPRGPPLGVQLAAAGGSVAGCTSAL
jgi:hypothetical protein